MNKLPCKDCITLAICRKLILDETKPISGNLFHKCRLLYDYIIREEREKGEDGFEHIKLSIDENKFEKLMDYMKNV